LPNVAPGSGPFPGKERRWVNAEAASASERHAAVCLYLALMTEACLGLIGAGGPVVVEGPFSLNEAYLDVVAALTGRDVIAVPGSTGTSAGAALLAGIDPIPGNEKHFPPRGIFHLPDYRRRWYAALA
jgi:sugar (pentulose or hexulose) kinase